MSGVITPLSLPAEASAESSIVHLEKATELVKVQSPAGQLPAKQGWCSFTRWLHYSAFDYYRKIFTIIFTANLIAFIVITVKNDGHPSAPAVGNATAANLMIALLFRQEHVVNLCYKLACLCPRSAPLWLRARLAKVFHYGGAHSGAGASAATWHILYTAVLTRDYIRSSSNWALAMLVTSYFLVALFVFILVVAHPTLRRRYHDSFEAVHRFSGWLALATFWMHTIFAALHTRSIESNQHSIGHILIHTPSFWMLCVSTSCLLLSWGYLRLRPVIPEVLSNHATRLHFNYRRMGPIHGIKVSTRPLMEWHSFATIPHSEEEGKGFSLIVSNAGDWTRNCITSPPAKLWIRGVPLLGLLHSAHLFKKVVVVATGSGVGPCMSLFAANAAPCRIFWSTPSPLVTYGAEIIEAVKRVDPEAWIWDTRTDGRPDMVAVTYKLFVEAQAEAVFIISNPKLTKQVVYGMESRGIPAYGAIWDS
ncbi:hypothetical protein FB45DRAFT_864514 [Roridomyces roridus]|uniref:Nonribosomal peptide synthetase 12 n=1 Tax=Roridomyces roridus TaxID=1738132 RepID=A0AAD7C1F7_9AGAR|nr:hypothetical protein FB45DRAFT_864514 [Roridomyces roridus]